MSNIEYPSYLDLKNRTVLITGSVTGNGANLVEVFVFKGSRVVFVDIQDEAS